MTIIVTYRSIDGYSQRRTFKTLKGARRFAHKWVGSHPEISEAFQYAVSGDGIGRVTWSGCTANDLFPFPPKT